MCPLVGKFPLQKNYMKWYSWTLPKHGFLSSKKPVKKQLTRLGKSTKEFLVNFSLPPASQWRDDFSSFFLSEFSRNRRTAPRKEKVWVRGQNNREIHNTCSSKSC